MDKSDIVAYRKRGYQIDALVADRTIGERKCKDAIVDAVSIDEIMLLLVKGELI